jgi:hypothetical protein
MKYGYLMVSLMLVGLLACSSEESGIKLSKSDRALIDTLSNREIVLLQQKYDKWYKDSSSILIQKATDSILQVRRAEIAKAMTK